MRIYVNAGLDAEAEALLLDGTRAHELVRGAATKSILDGGVGDSLDGIDVVFGQPDPRALVKATCKLVQLTSAGWTRYDDDALKATLRAQGAALCNASSVFAAPVAEHAIAMMLALSRRLLVTADTQRGDHAWPSAERRAEARVLRDEVVLVLGYGAIARAIAERLFPFGCELVGYRRRVRGDENIRTVDGGGLAAEWARADHIIDVLPESDETKLFVNAARLATCKRGARFYNLGRGSTVDQAALVAALHDRLDAAYLDVTTPEPLPVDSPLWSTPNLHVTPHVGGGHRGELSSLVRLFLHNLVALDENRPLFDRVV